MSTTAWLIIVVAALALGGAVGWYLLRWRRRRHLSDRFGPEYDREVEDAKKRSEAERRLEEREKRVEVLDIRPLPAEERRKYVEAWNEVQGRFVDAPSQAVHEADDLIGEVMERRGYPVGDFERRAEDLSVDHADVVQNYRRGHELADRSREGRADTEDLRQAMVHYRALFDELLEAEPSSRDGRRAGTRERTREEVKGD